MSDKINEKLFKILLEPRVTEKGTRAEMDRQYVFRVLKDATKPQIKKAVELMFGVKVNAVRICNVKPKEKRFGQIMGRRQGFKKAYVSLKEGHVLKLAGA
jgi:large subunit ribosomal protein L23